MKAYCARKQIDASLNSTRLIGHSKTAFSIIHPLRAHCCFIGAKLIHVIPVSVMFRPKQRLREWLMGLILKETAASMTEPTVL